jgi:hypothetical protein
VSDVREHLVRSPSRQARPSAPTIVHRMRTEGFLRLVPNREPGVADARLLSAFSMLSVDRSALLPRGHRPLIDRSNPSDDLTEHAEDDDGSNGDDEDE